jgi:hypothetical protein
MPLTYEYFISSTHPRFFVVPQPTHYNGARKGKEGRVEKKKESNTSRCYCAAFSDDPVFLNCMSFPILPLPTHTFGTKGKRGRGKEEGMKGL